mgnify:CR=1 FL=1
MFTLVTAGHLRVRSETGARLSVLLVAIATTVVVLATFATTTLVDEPATAVVLLAIVAVSVVLDAVWKSRRGDHPTPTAAPAPTV